VRLILGFIGLGRRRRIHWPYLTIFFRYPAELRRIIYTTNAIESPHSQMRKNIATRKVFPQVHSPKKVGLGQNE
jgi:putative transposase